MLNDPGEELGHFVTRDMEAAVAATTAVVDEVLGASYPAIPDAAAAQFSSLADTVKFSFVVVRRDGQNRPGDLDRFRFSVGDTGRAGVQLSAVTPVGLLVAALGDFLENPQRDRLRRCQECGRWFVDETRNRSARRCSRACTITWSNKQRPKGGAR